MCDRLVSDRIFEAVREVITATGVLTGKTRRALDSTVLDDAVARQDTITQLIASIRRRTAPDRMISTVDPDARDAHKSRERRQDGFKAHIVIEPDTGLMTRVALTKTNGADNSDAAVGADLVTTDPTLTDGQVEVLGDSAY